MQNMAIQTEILMFLDVEASRRQALRKVYESHNHNTVSRCCAMANSYGVYLKPLAIAQHFKLWPAVLRGTAGRPAGWRRSKLAIQNS